MNTIKYSVNTVANPQKRGETIATARVQMNTAVSSAEFVKHISDHNGVFSKGTVKGVTTDMVGCLREMLLAGNKVEIDGLGTFFISLQSKSAASIDKFTSANIEKVNVLFTPSAELEDLVREAVFEQVTTRAAQAATLKAQKEGKTVVDLTQSGGTDAPGASEAPSGGGSGNSGGGDTGGGSDTGGGTSPDGDTPSYE